MMRSLLLFVIIQVILLRPLIASNFKCPKVFVYDIPSLWDFEIPLRELSTVDQSAILAGTCIDTPEFVEHHKTTQHAMAMMVLYRLVRSRRCAPTIDPKEADLFLIPTLPRYKNSAQIDAACESAPADVELLLPHLTKINAHKHFMLLSKGHVAMNLNKCTWWKNPTGLMKEVIRVSFSPVIRGDWQNDETVMHDHVVTVAYGPNDSLEWTKDRLAATVDYMSDNIIFPHSFSIPYPSAVNWEFNRPNAPWKKYKEERTVIASFIGALHGGYGASIRLKIVEDCKRVGELCYVDLLNYPPEEAHWRCTYLKPKTKSVFCLEPGGDSPYRKSISDDLLFGCIPVIFSPYIELATPWHWDHFINDTHVYVNGPDYVAGKIDLFKILHGLIDSGRAREMRKVIAEEAHAFQYTIDDYPGDAFERLLAGVQAASMALGSGTLDLKNAAVTPKIVDVWKNPCMTSFAELRKYWLNKGTFGVNTADFISLIRVRNNLYVRGIDGMIHCEKPVAVIFEAKQKKTDALFTFKCAQNVEFAHQSKAFSKDPVNVMRKLTEGSRDDPLCCHHYANFSRLFFDHHNSFTRLKDISKKEDVIQELIEIQSGDEYDEGWKIHALYAQAMTIYADGRNQEAYKLLSKIIRPSPKFEEKILLKATSAGFNQDPPEKRRLIYATVASNPRLEVEYLIHSAAAASVPIYLLGFGVPYEGNQVKARLYLEFLSSMEHDRDVVVFVDAFDGFILPSSSQFLMRFDAFRAPIVFGAGDALFPDVSLADFYNADEVATTAYGNFDPKFHPWVKGKPYFDLSKRFLNGGTVAGEVWAMILLVKRLQGYGSIVKCGPSEQRGLHRIFLENPRFIRLDYGGVLFFQQKHAMEHNPLIDSKGQLHMSLNSTSTGPDPIKFKGSENLWKDEWRETPAVWHGPGRYGKESFPILARQWLSRLRRDAN